MYPTTRLWCSEPKKIANRGDLLISVRAPIGAINYAKETCCIGRGLAKLKINPNIADNKFLYYFLLSQKSYFNSQGNGSTFKAISKNILEDTKIPFYNLAQQKYIGNILNKIYIIQSQYKQILSLCDIINKALFAEMFGTFPKNEKNFRRCKIGDIVDEVKYGSSRKASENNSGKYPYLRMNNITYEGKLDLSDIKTIDIPDNELDKCMVKKGDVLFNRTNSKDLVGKTCVYDRDEMMILAGFIIRVRVNNNVLPEFLSAFLNTDFSKKMLREKCKAAIGQANINAQELKSIGIYIPPIDLQHKFKNTIIQIDKHKSVVQKSLDETQLLFDSLMQKYFG